MRAASFIWPWTITNGELQMGVCYHPSAARVTELVATEEWNSGISTRYFGTSWGIT